MNVRNIAGATLSFLVLCLASALVYSQVESEGVFRDTVEVLYGERSEFTVDDADVEVINFDTPHKVRVCVNKAEHTVPLKVEYGDKAKNVKPGECAEVKGKEIAFSAAGQLEEGWKLFGSFEDFGPDSKNKK